MIHVYVDVGRRAPIVEIHPSTNAGEKSKRNTLARGIHGRITGHALLFPLAPCNAVDDETWKRFCPEMTSRRRAITPLGLFSERCSSGVSSNHQRLEKGHETTLDDLSSIDKANCHTVQ
jgi:hypothetical protein